MTEYIEREQLIGSLEDVIADYRDEHTFSTDFAATVVIDILNNIVKCQPAADVEPVNSGQWIHKIMFGEQAWFCSECKTIGSPAWKRCPVCEAKMDEEAQQ